jgi:hypothetical protein
MCENLWLAPEIRPLALQHVLRQFKELGYVPLSQTGAELSSASVMNAARPSSRRICRSRNGRAFSKASVSRVRFSIRWPNMSMFWSWTRATGSSNRRQGGGVPNPPTRPHRRPIPKPRGEGTLARLRKKTPGLARTLHYADHTRISEMKRVAAEVAEAEPRIDVLVNNAGAMFSTHKLTEDGLEYTFALNHMVYFVVTQGLRERLVASAPARVVSTRRPRIRARG